MKIKIDLSNLPKITNSVYYPLYLDKHRYLVLYGGAGSGKSVFAAQKILFRSIVEGNHRFLVVRKVARTLRNSVFTLFRDMLPHWGLTELSKINKSEMTISFPIFNSEILFAGMDNPEKIKSIAGITGIWIEEATELNEDDFKQLDLRLRGKTKSYKQIILTFNPIDVNHWLKKFIDLGKKNLKVIRTTYRDNKFIDEEYKNILKDLQNQDKQFYSIYALGEWGVFSNLIYTNWDTVDDIPENYGEVFYGLDFGYNNPSALVAVYSEDQEYFIHEVLYQTKLTNQQLIDRMKELIPSGSTIYADAAEPARIEEIRRAGFNVYPANKNIKDGIDYVKRHKLHITKSSSNILKEISSYKWKEDKDGNALDEPVKFLDHAMDALRYAIFTHGKRAFTARPKGNARIF